MNINKTIRSSQSNYKVQRQKEILKTKDFRKKGEKDNTFRGTTIGIMAYFSSENNGSRQWNAIFKVWGKGELET